MIGDQKHCPEQWFSKKSWKYLYKSIFMAVGEFCNMMCLSNSYFELLN